MRKIPHSTFLEAKGGSKKLLFPLFLRGRDLLRSTLASYKVLTRCSVRSGPRLRFLQDFPARAPNVLQI